MFDVPVFKRPGYELISESSDVSASQNDDPEQMFGCTDHGDLIARATRRAKIAAFDLIACNPDLNAFCTFTYSPEQVDRASYDDVYKKLSIWCSNRVQRHGLKYVAVPEHHKDGEAIHFHALCNADALDLIRAYSPHTGLPLYQKGRAVYNIPSWRYGFSTAIKIGSTETDRDKVVKYIYKYMGKQQGQKIGGRYYLHGGDLKTPVFRIGDEPDEFIVDHDGVKYYRVEVLDHVGHYYEWSFI